MKKPAKIRLIRVIRVLLFNISDCMLHYKLTEKIIKGFYTVYNTLGYGFLENVYENALLIELNKMGLETVQQKRIQVLYNGYVVGDYYADIIINDLIIIEVKAAEGLRDQHRNQLINYLKATDKEVGLLLNFGKIPEFKRVIFTNEKRDQTEPNQPNLDILITPETEKGSSR
jgi:GxxExxY protein